MWMRLSWTRWTALKQSLIHFRTSISGTANASATGFAKGIENLRRYLLPLELSCRALSSKGSHLLLHDVAQTGLLKVLKLIIEVFDLPVSKQRTRIDQMRFPPQVLRYLGTDITREPMLIMLVMLVNMRESICHQ